MFCFLLQRYGMGTNTMFVKQNNIVFRVKGKGTTNYNSFTKYCFIIFSPLF